jgi:hypothetical protein
MTMNVYGHVNVDTQRIALDRLEDELSGCPDRAVAVTGCCHALCGDQAH